MQVDTGTKEPDHKVAMQLVLNEFWPLFRPVENRKLEVESLQQQ